MLEKTIDQIIQKATSGNASEREMHLLNNWLEEAPGNRAVYERLKAVVESAEVCRDVPFTGPAFEKVWEKAQRVKSKSTDPASFRAIALGIAAGLIILVCALIVLHQSRELDQSKIPSKGVTVKSTLPGQKMKIFLPDGSYAWLNSNSEIAYVKDFADSERVVGLKGEAFFSVIKNPEKPFSVVAGNTRVIALGTEFNVNNYPGSEAARVALAEGKVKVEEVNNVNYPSTILDPGQSAFFSAERQKFIVDPFDPEQTLDWKDGILYFKEAGFQETLDILERWYGVSILYNRLPPHSWQFSGSFKNEYLEYVLQAMGFGENFEFTIDGKNVELKF